MRLAIFAKTFPRPSLEETLDAVVAAGFDAAQFNLALAGGASPEAIAAAHRVRGLEMAACSGTVNLAHPDPARRAAGLAWLVELIAAAPALGTRVVTLCTGTRDPDDTWRGHPDNATRAAWADMRESIGTAVAAAEAAGITLGVEPELGNIVRDAVAARRLLDEVASPALRIVMDAANLEPGAKVLRSSFELLGGDVVLAHAKDVDGVVDYPLYLSLLRDAGFGGPLVLHGMPETEVAAAVAFIGAT
jgi:sugar phosphate isomerase/epimerase